MTHHPIPTTEHTMQNEQELIDPMDESNGSTEISDQEHKIISGRFHADPFSSRDWPGRFQNSQPVDCQQVFRSTKRDVGIESKSNSEQSCEERPDNNRSIGNETNMEHDIPEPLPVEGAYRPLNAEETEGVMEALVGADIRVAANDKAASEVGVDSAIVHSMETHASDSESGEIVASAFITQGRAPRTRVARRDVDVVLGRGETANTHSGNILFREERDKLKEMYKKAERNKRKKIAARLARRVHRWGGAFIRKNSGKNDTWSEVPDSEAINKCAHALREKKELKKRKQVSTVSISKTHSEKKRPPST